MSCATVTIKYLVFIFNTLCALFGIGTITVNALALKNLSSNGYMICVFLIVLASIMFVISFVGCCGAIRESSCLTWLYVIFLLMLITANWVIMFGYISHIDGESHAHNDIKNIWSTQTNETDAMSFIQKNLQCCGIESYTDYTKTNITIPKSCYSDDKVMYSEGCLMKLIKLYETAEHWVKVIAWSSTGVEFIALICAYVLAITFRNQQRRTRYKKSETRTKQQRTQK